MLPWKLSMSIFLYTSSNVSGRTELLDPGEGTVTLLSGIGTGKLSLLKLPSPARSCRQLGLNTVVHIDFWGHENGRGICWERRGLVGGVRGWGHSGKNMIKVHLSICVWHYKRVNTFKKNYHMQTKLEQGQLINQRQELKVKPEGNVW